MRAIWVSAAVLLLPGLAFAQQGRYNPAVVGNPSYTGYGAPPPTYIPGALHNPSYTGYNAPRYGTGFNPSYTGYNYQPYGTGYNPSSYNGSGYQPYNSSPSYGTNYDYAYPYTGYSGYRAYGEARLSPGGLYGPLNTILPDMALQERPPADLTPQAVTLEVKVPNPAAEVFVEGGKTRSVGLDRTFVSPKMEAGTRYTYEVMARWTQDGKEVEQTRRVPVRAGEKVVVDFTRPEK
jgi:uncharacterized protein (TIGR03000 family)